MNTILITKKISALMLTMALLSFGAAAQDEDDELKPHAGIKGGVSFSNFAKEGENITDENVRVGYNVGVFAKLPLSSHFAIQPELLVISKGTKASYDYGVDFFGTGLGKGTVDFNLTYLELPIMAVINFNEYLNVQGGVYGAYLLNANTKNTSNNPSYNSYEDLNEDHFQRFDYGAAVGLGVDLHPVTTGVRYEYSLRNLGTSGPEGEMTKNARNSCLSLYVGFGF